MAFSSSLRSPCSLPNLTVYTISLLLFTLSSASLTAILLLRSPPTTFGSSLLIISAASLLSALLALFSHAARAYFIAHVSLASTALAGQALAVFTLFLQPELSLELLAPTTKTRKPKMMEKIEAGMFVGMFVLEAALLVVACAVERSWRREHKNVEKGKGAAGKKRSRRVAMECEDSMENVVAEVDAKNDFET